MQSETQPSLSGNPLTRQRLSRHLREDDGFLESLPPWVPADLRVGPYRQVREVGAGGMGVVWEGERSDDLYQKRVAIRFIKRGMHSEEVLRRFRREREILARLEHPSIARLLDAGITSDGRPWFAMEFVEGVPITVYCRRSDLSLENRLVLFRSVCQAVHFAHRNRVVHQDLKPSSILVTDDGTAKLPDFGVARLLDPEAVGEGKVTRLGARAMTPAYPSPELRQGWALTTASDVYSLGLLLHEILTGKKGSLPGDPGEGSGGGAGRRPGPPPGRLPRPGPAGPRPLPGPRLHPPEPGRSHGRLPGALSAPRHGNDSLMAGAGRGPRARPRGSPCRGAPGDPLRPRLRCPRRLRPPPRGPPGPGNSWSARPSTTWSALPTWTPAIRHRSGTRPGSWKERAT